MKKLFLTLCLVGGALISQAQDTKFGARTGIDIASVTVTVPGFGSATASETGFFVGGFATFGLNET